MRLNNVKPSAEVKAKRHRRRSGRPNALDPDATGELRAVARAAPKPRTEAALEALPQSAMPTTSIFEKLTKIVPLLISSLALIISILGYQAQRVRDLPILLTKYAVVQTPPHALETPRATMPEAETRSSYFSARFFDPLREALGAQLSTLDSLPLKETENYFEFNAVRVLILQNVHNVPTAEIQVRYEVEISDHPPPSLFDTVPSTPDIEIRRLNGEWPTSTHREGTLHLSAMKPGDIAAIPLQLEYPTNEMLAAMEKPSKFVQLKVKTVIYGSSDAPEAIRLIPRAELEVPSTLMVRPKATVITEAHRRLPP